MAISIAASQVDRVVPSWAAGLIARLSRDRPAVVTRSDLAVYMGDANVDRTVDRVASDLQQLGWLSTLRLRAVWAFVPAGESAVAVRSTDPYLDLRGWLARDPDAVFALAGEAAAWHLGYLPRRFEGSTSIWIPAGTRVPHGLRAEVSLVRLRWPTDSARRLGPTSRQLAAKRLDLTGWASGLPALGPEAIVAQIAARPASFRAWADLIGQLDVLVGDCDPGRLRELLDGFSVPTWQRAAYLLDRGGLHDAGVELLDGRAIRAMSVAQFGDASDVVWSQVFQVNDHLIAPLQQRLGKA